MSSIVTFVDVSFEFPNGHSVFTQLNFSLPQGLTALIGPNGVGKSTLAKLIMKELVPSRGIIHSHVSSYYFPQILAPENISVAQYLTDKYEWSLIGQKFLDGIDPETLCTHLSGGQWMRVRLALALSYTFLILDEPTNNLDRESRDVLIDFLKEFEGSALIISHDRECLSLCKKALELSNQGLSQYGGGWKNYESLRQSERTNSAEKLEAAKLHRESTTQESHQIKDRQEKRNRRGAEKAARGGMPKILIGARKRKAQVTTGRIDAATFEKAKESVQEAFQAYNALKVDSVMYGKWLGQSIASQKLVAEAEKFNVCYQKWVFKKDLNFVWRGNIRVHLKGANGSGKSTLLQALLGKHLTTRGKIKLGDLKTLYIDQQCSQLDQNLSIYENIRNSSDLLDHEIRNGLAYFLFHKDSVFQKVSTLSGGERLRATLALGLLRSEQPELLILDEPTNNLDLVNIEFLENWVSQFQGAVIMITHDNVFLKNCEITEEFSITSL